MSFRHLPFTSSILDPNTLRSTPFTKSRTHFLCECDITSRNTTRVSQEFTWADDKNAASSE